MRHHVKGGLFAASALLSGTALVQAADLPARTPPTPVFVAPVVGGWDGFYAGSTYGYDFTTFRTRQGNGPSRSVSKSGSSSGAFVGYNYQFGHIVVGAEGGVDIDTVSGDEKSVPPGGTLTRLDSLWDARLRARAGYEFGWWMPFVAGGAVINQSYQSIPAPFHAFGSDRTSVGYTIGAGVDVKVNPAAYLGLQNGFLASLLGPLVLRVEYLHDGLPTSTYDFAGQSFRTKSESNIVRVALIQRFGDNPPRPYIDQHGDVNWAGGYGGVFGGGGFLNPSTQNLATGGKNSFSASGPIGGVYTGTNFIFAQHYMIGVEGSTSYADIEGNGLEPTGPSRYRNYINGDLRARAGYAYGRLLPFLAAGFNVGRASEEDTVTRSQLGHVTEEAIEAGAGIDYRLTERTSVRGEYIHDFNVNDKHLSLDDVVTKQTVDGNLFRVGLAYHFE